MADHYDDISYEEQDISDETVSINLSMNKVIPLQDDEFIEAAGLQRTGQSGRKSSVEKLLEQSLNTVEQVAEIHERRSPLPRLANGVTTQYLSSGSDDDSPVRRGAGSRITPEKPQNLKSDKFLQDAGLSRTGQVPRQSAKERLLEDQLKTNEERPQQGNVDNVCLIKGKQQSPVQTEHSSLARRSSTSNSNNNNDDEDKQNKRKNSIYDQKNIEAPITVKGNRITSRTENLFKQYERDMTIHEPKPLTNVNTCNIITTRKVKYTDVLAEESKVDIAREEKERELHEIRMQYQQRLEQEEQVQAEERAKRNADAEVKSVQKLGDIKSRYLAIAKGEAAIDHSDEEDGNPSDSNVIKSGGKEEVVASGVGVGNIRDRFGSIGKAGWSKTSEDTEAVDSSKVNSARNVFKNFESNNQNSQQQSFVRPTSRKVRDPKELMEMRKKITYGGDNDELPQDGVVKKSVVLDDVELGYTTSTKKDALNVYKNFDTSKDLEQEPLQKPKNHLLSENEAMANVEIKKIENTDEEETNHHGDVSGYDTGTPCSPASTTSDGYSSLSDSRDLQHIDDLTNMKLSHEVNVKLSPYEDKDAQEIDVGGALEFTC